MVKFKVMSSDEVIEQKILGYDEYQKRKEIYDDFNWVLVEFDDDGKPIREVGEDGGEPEDQKLVRDWSWVPDEINKIADRERKLKRLCLEAANALWAMAERKEPNRDPKSINQDIYKLLGKIGYPPKEDQDD